jgi:hypothetical protein
MSKSRPDNKEELKEYIVRKLGGEWHPIELSDDNLEDVIMDALTFYMEQIYDGSKNVVVNLDVQEGTMDYNLRTLVGDGIFAVTEIVASGFQSGILPSAYGLSQSEVQFLFSLGSIPSGGLVDFSIKMQHFEAFNSLYIPKPNWNYNYGTGILTFNADPFKFILNNGQARLHLICAQLLDHDGTGGGRYWANRWLLQYAQALAWINYGINIGKFSGMSNPGGGEVNYQAFIDRGTQMKTDLEQFAYDNLSRNPESFEIHMA